MFNNNSSSTTVTSTSSYWYNSQSIPLAEFWRIYRVPIVYTYTELSAASGQHLLQASMESVRLYMPDNPIHILYHADSDNTTTTTTKNVHRHDEFLAWLQSRHVHIHFHHPVWKDQIEQMRLNGDPQTSHLFLHAGNYLGTWQRMDIPLFLETEYALLLDADTVIVKPFTLADFGLDLTHAIAMSSELNSMDQNPSNAGVMLMNIPFLRRTHKSFVKYVLRHADTGRFQHDSPSDQGAYLSYYRQTIKFMDSSFNRKPYHRLKGNGARKRAILTRKPPNENSGNNKAGDTFIIHFHGPKPHNYIQHILGGTCNKAFEFLCAKGVEQFPGALCFALTAFARATLAVDRTGRYCQSAFQIKKHGDGIVTQHAQWCQYILETLSERDQCVDPKTFFASIKKAFASSLTAGTSKQKEGVSESFPSQLLERQEPLIGTSKVSMEREFSQRAKSAHANSTDSAIDMYRIDQLARSEEMESPIIQIIFAIVVMGFAGYTFYFPMTRKRRVQRIAVLTLALASFNLLHLAGFHHERLKDNVDVDFLMDMLSNTSGVPILGNEYIPEPVD